MNTDRSTLCSFSLLLRSPTLDVARDLIGKVLVHNRRGVARAASSSRSRRTSASPIPRVMRHRAANGAQSHRCMARRVTRTSTSITAFTASSTSSRKPQDSPAAVLIRALDPVDGIEIMRRRTHEADERRRRRRRAVDDHALCRGPGNLTMAMGITLADNRVDLQRRLIIHRGLRHPPWVDRLGAAAWYQGWRRASVEGVRARLRCCIQRVTSDFRLQASGSDLRVES